MYFLIGIILLIGFIVIDFQLQDKKLLETVTKSNRGTKTERDLVLRLLKSKIPAQTIFHDLYVKKYYGHYSQIDLVVTTKVGIIVFEVKDYSGWIYGNGYQSQWVQVLAYGKEKYRFYNPIMQNNKHIEDLKKKLNQFENIPFYSIVVFYGNSRFQNVVVPDETFLVKSEEVMRTMKKIIDDNEPARYTNKKDIVRVLKEAVKNGESIEIQNKHIKNIKNILS